jgi:hypothetical protein
MFMSLQQDKRLATTTAGFALSILTVAAFAFGLSQSSQAEEIKIGEDSGEMVAGDFRCKPCHRPIINSGESFCINGQAMTTGDLYRYFQSRGITNIDRLSLQVDIDCCPEEDRAFQLDDLDFRITGSDNTVIAEASLREDSLLFSGEEISSFKPEAVLEIDLGYNFMDRFSPESTEAIELSYSSPPLQNQMTPRFVVSEDTSSFSSSNISFLTLFVAFWIFVFFVMNFMVKPNNDDLPPKAGGLVGG